MSYTALTGFSRLLASGLGIVCCLMERKGCVLFAVVGRGLGSEVVVMMIGRVVELEAMLLEDGVVIGGGLEGGGVPFWKLYDRNWIERSYGILELELY